MAPLSLQGPVTAPPQEVHGAPEARGCRLASREEAGRACAPTTADTSGAGGHLGDLLRRAVCTALQHPDDLLVVGRVFCEADFQLPEKLATLLESLLLLELTKEKDGGRDVTCTAGARLSAPEQEPGKQAGAQGTLAYSPVILLETLASTLGSQASSDTHNQDANGRFER